MEEELLEWIHKFVALNGKQPEKKLVKKMAIQFSNHPSKFKASKGWFEKFVSRYEIHWDS
jgi:hypothetical protein